MPVIALNNTLPWTQIIASAGQTVFSTNWTADALTDVVVYSRTSIQDADDATQVLQTMDYNVAFVGSNQYVQVTLSTPSLVGDIVTIIRNTPADRLNLYTNTNFNPTMLNGDFNREVMMIQQRLLCDIQLAPKYNNSATLNPNGITDIILPVLPASSVWIKDPTNEFITTALLPANPIGSVDGDFTHSGRLVITDISTGNDIDETNLELISGDIIQSVNGAWGLNSTGNFSLDATGNLLLQGQAFPAATGTAGQVIGVITPNVLGYLNVPTTSGSTTVNQIPIFTSAIGALGDSDFSQSGTDLLLPANPMADLAAVTKQYVDGLISGTVASVSGTNNQVNVNNSDPENPIISLSATLLAPGTLSAITSVGTGNVRLQGNSLISTNTDGDLNLTPNGAGVVVLANSQITSLTASDMVATDGSKNLVSINFNPVNLPYAVLQSGSPIFGADAGSTDSYAITLSPAPAAYVVGMEVRFSANTQNTSGATLNVNSLGALAILKFHDQPLATGDIEVGQISTVIYDGTNWQLQSSTAATPGTGTVNSALINQLAWYAASGAAVSGLATAASGMLVTDTGGVPSISSTPPAAVLANIPGRLLGFQRFLSGSGATYTPTPGTKTAWIRMLGGGGAGGGAQGVGGNTAGGGGGGSGGYLEHLLTGVAGTYTYTVGAGGTPGSAGNVAGGNGGASTFSGGTLSANGGAGGGGAAAQAGAAVVQTAVGGAQGTASGGNIFTLGGQAGQPGYAYLNSGVISGNGGDGLVSGSAIGVSAGAASQTVGTGAQANTGSGGSGGASFAGSSVAGGAGAAGFIIIFEYN